MKERRRETLISMMCNFLMLLFSLCACFGFARCKLLICCNICIFYILFIPNLIVCRCVWSLILYRKIHWIKDMRQPIAFVVLVGVYANHWRLTKCKYCFYVSTKEKQKDVTSLKVLKYFFAEKQFIYIAIRGWICFFVKFYRYQNLYIFITEYWCNYSQSKTEVWEVATTSNCARQMRIFTFLLPLIIILI